LASRYMTVAEVLAREKALLANGDRTELDAATEKAFGPVIALMLAKAKQYVEQETGPMGYVFNDGKKLDDKDEVLRQAEAKLVAARDLLKRCRAVLTLEDEALYAEITDFIGD